MKIRVSDIPEEGLTLRTEYGGEILEGCVPVEGPISVNMRMERAGRNVRVRGDIRTTLRLNCSRCVEDFSWIVASEFDFPIITPEDSGKHPDRSLSPEDMEVSFFDGESVDVERIAAEQIFLLIPIKPLCREECEGLCPRCGANLNLGPCRCTHEAGSSPFDALRDMKPKH